MQCDKKAIRWPAEWESQDAVWLSWPHRQELWQGGLAQLDATFAEVVAAIVPHAQVCINVAQSLHAHIMSSLQQGRVDGSRVCLYNHPTDDVWCRDHGPIFVKRGLDCQSELVVTDWQFNAWGGKFPPWDRDNDIPARVADSLKLPRLTSSMILEGGAIEGNGDGLLLTTEAVLLNKNRNPGWSRAEVEAELRRLLGVTSVFWLGRGIEGDDTDGHIDDMVRFCHSYAVLSIVEDNAKSPHYHALAENNERLQDLRHPDGGHVEVIPLPLPDPIVADDWRLEQLPASYANFLICNGAVIVPIFAQSANDDRALGIIREAFPLHQIRGVDARNLILEGGAIHCITQQQPK